MVLISAVPYPGVAYHTWLGPTISKGVNRTVLSLCSECMRPACSPGPDGSGNRFIAESTLQELEERFTQFLLHYQHQVQSSTGLTPLECWQEQCRPSAVDPRMLSLLLCDGGQRRVLKDGIRYQSNVYWHADLAHYVGKEVSIRMKYSQNSPETIEVFFEHQWICSASLQEEANESHLPHENERM